MPNHTNPNNPNQLPSKRSAQPPAIDPYHAQHLATLNAPNNTTHSQRQSSGAATASLILGIISLTLTFMLLGIFTAIPGIICGHIGHDETKNSLGHYSNAGSAVAGLIMNYISLALAIISWASIVYIIYYFLENGGMSRLF